MAYSPMKNEKNYTSIENYIYDKVFNNNYSAITNSMVSSNRCTVNKGGIYKDENNHKWIYVDLTLKTSMAAGDVWGLLVNLPYSADQYRSLNSRSPSGNPHVIYTAGNSLALDTSNNTPGANGHRIIAYGDF